ncbi:MAG: FKBP-type peptidyl-prolyl cis-trans isomerase [Bacteroides sp.]|jgi:FKBP-type peptidyl-prolyl cis-trans isomerase FklB|nr:FKBP-type peptidyl-prolyl cis-trans isomerase [Bacteroides sp.]MCI1681279.1 FKBP-type peptidyl-prolyl cis-trans isomerase [Bacteroides sp.]
MKKPKLIFLPCLLLLSALLVACSESTEVGKYHDWQARNEAFIDSIKALSPTAVETAEAAAAMPVGKLFTIPVATSGNLPIYCEKIEANPEGRRPLYTERVNVYYYGTLITGDRFDSNFEGYSVLDHDFTAGKNPTDFDSTSTFSVSGVISGWVAALQYMRTGERWMLYIPWDLAYGASDSGSIPGYSALTFDVKLVSVEE